MTLGNSLRRTQDRKTANLTNKAGTQSKIANAFSLPAGQAFSCPGATTFCERVCYAGKLEKMYPSFRKVVVHNFDLLKDASFADMVKLLSSMIDDFRRECDKWDAPKKFRIHADGDFFSARYARAWAYVVRSNPDITFWVYTRSFTDKLNVINWITGIPNLAVYLSVDVFNKKFVAQILEDYPEVRIALLADTMAEAAIEMKEFSDRPGAKCPENIKSIPLINDKGGACVSCDLCVSGKVNVRFAAKKR